MPRQELEALQWRKLQAALGHAYEGSPFWRQRMDAAGCRPDQVRSLADYRERFPILTRDDITAAERDSPPYGTLASCDPRLAIRHHQTSGTTGKPPVRTFDTARDWAWASDMWCSGLYGMGIRPEDREIAGLK